jgi:serine/threonine protein kinase
MERHSQILSCGDQIENYTIERLIGAGGFGMTYRGFDRSLGCAVAIKEYFPSRYSIRDSSCNNIMPKSPSYRNSYKFGLQRFLKEAQVLAQFKNRNIVRVSRFLETNNTAYIIMDYEEGVSLQRFLDSVSKLNEKELRQVALPIMKGLRAVHNSNYLHRDIKPSNIYLRKNGSPVLIDFGSARQAMADVSVPLTVEISEGYAPFEQYSNHSKQGPWTDLYGLGATLYHCISGNRPVDSLSRLTSMHNNQDDPLIPALQIGKGLYSNEILRTIDRMLSLNGKDRPSSIDPVILVFAKKTNTVANELPLHEEESENVLSSAHQYEWDMDIVRTIESRLANYMGPLASILVKQAMPQCRSIDELFDVLSDSINEPIERQKFYTDINLKTSVTLPKSISKSRITQSKTKAATVQHISDEFITFAEKQLTHYIGPLASTLVKNALKEVSNIDGLMEILSCELSSEEERIAFIKGLELHQSIIPG